MRKVILFLILIFAVALAPIHAQEELDTVTMTTFPFLSYAPLFIAAEEGYFAEQGIEMVFTSGLQDTEVITALLQGDLDLAVHFLTPALFNSITRGADMRVVADKGHLAAGHCASSAFVARTDLVESGTLNDPAALSELVFSFELNTIEEYVLEKAYAAQGIELDFDSMTIEDLAPPAMQEALINDAVAGGFASEPWVTRALNTGETSVWVSSEDAADGLQASMIVFGPRLLHEDPELGERVMTAYLQGVRQYNEGATERNIEIIAQYTELDPKLVETACWAGIADDGVILTDGLMEIQDWMLERDLLDRVVPVEEFWEPRFVDFANEALSDS